MLNVNLYLKRGSCINLFYNTIQVAQRQLATTSCQYATYVRKFWVEIEKLKNKKFHIVSFSTRMEPTILSILSNPVRFRSTKRQLPVQNGIKDSITRKYDGNLGITESRRLGENGGIHTYLHIHIDSLWSETMGCFVRVK